MRFGMTRTINDVHVHLGKSSIINNWLSADDILSFREKNNVDNFFLMSLDLGIEHNNKKIIEYFEENTPTFLLFLFSNCEDC